MNEPTPSPSNLTRIPFWVYVVIVPVLALVAVVAVRPGSDGGTASAAGATGAAGADAVSIANFTFAPNVIEVPVGTTLTVTNRDGTAHTFTAHDGSFDTGDIAGGSGATVTLDRAGTYAYFCRIHQYMKGTLRVS